MIYFDSDYMTGAHPLVLKRLNETNSLHTVGYGRDEFTAEARRMILDACGIDDGEVYFLEGGTQTNAVVIDRLLDHNDGVIATDTAHINVHEAGAIEATGHKVLALPNHDGKLRACDIRDYIADFYRDDTHHYMVRPAMVYISYPTELGTIYSRDELEAISTVCREADVPLYIDGARLAYGLAADGADLSLKDIASLCDVFYIGGTKCGALFGEAVVTRRPELLPRFVSLIKLRGATLAKGRLLGVQFSTLFTDDLYCSIGRHAVALAMKLKSGFVNKGYRLYMDSPTNQQFFVMPNDKIDELREVASFELWGPKGDVETPVRFVTDWATTERDIDELIAAL
ncbi:low specificity L-threonine aldolase [uncultured Muribaculum sp.]|uniref:threonine aldolase family protein n=1 Tax=uncultured Muribaculum sp. TaxID=1918613 RepID=UPI00271216D3|nr:aminotransferase class V-fold PLP-dependent enzyme [uncultured Muribaculum sp.]